MSEFLPSIIIKPKWFRIAPRLTGFGKREPYVIGFDTEAYRGSPMLMQFALPDQTIDDVSLVWTNARNCLSDFLDFIEPIAKRVGRTHQIIIYGWNLRYEYTQLFRNLPRECWEESRFIMHLHDNGVCDETPNDGWDISIDVMNDKLHAVKMGFGSKRDNRKGRKGTARATVEFLDGMAFFNTSLNKAAGIVGVEGKDDFPDAQKGTIRPTMAKRNPALIHYARKDALVTRQIGEKIVDYHRRYDIPVTMSAPMFASYVYKRSFLDGEIPLCDEGLEDAGLKSYHGGKNGYYLDRPMFFEHAYDYDVNAAYTSAMAALPDPVNAIWEDHYSYIPDVHAIWFVRARVRSCVYRAFQENTGRWMTWKEDGFREFWITSYELDQAIHQGEIADMLECTGYVMHGEPGAGSLNRFCQEMYELKRYGATPEERQMAKLCLNSIYGKFIQKVPNNYNSVFPFYDWVDLPDGGRKIVDVNMTEGGYRAGGLYHPALASLVTGAVRARIHSFEHKYQSLMTSTDGFLSLTPPDQIDIGDHFGGLKVKEGSLSIWRERLYLFETPGADPVFALHGFRGRLDDLRKIPLEPGLYKYQGTMMIGLRDSLNMHAGARYRPGEFASLPWELDLREVSARSPIRA